MDPMLSKSLLAGETFKCTEELVSIISMLSVNNAIFFRPKDKAVHADKAHKQLHRPHGDHMTLLNIWNQWAEMNYSVQWCFENFIQPRSMKRARDVREQLIGLMDRVDLELVGVEDPADTVPIRKCLAAGFFSNSARLQKSGDSYRTLKQNQTVLIHPSSTLFSDNPKWVIFYELVLTSKEFMRQVLEIDAKWLVEVAPHYVKAHDVADGDRGPGGKNRMPKALGKSIDSI